MSIAEAKCAEDCIMCEAKKPALKLIEVECSRCYTMEVTPEYIFLIPAHQGATYGSYAFVCPGCDERQARKAGEGDFLKLCELGVETLPDLSETYIIFFALNLAEVPGISEAAKNFQ